MSNMFAFFWVGVVFILAVFNDTVVKILAHDKGCETPLSLLDS